MTRLAWAGALAALLVISGCGQAGNRPAGVVSDATMPVLAASAVPGVPSVTTLLTSAQLAKDASIPGLAAKIESWGYLGGRQRTFQGESRYLTLAVSRALMFRDTAGALHYTAFVHDHQAAFFGAFARTQGLTGQDVSGHGVSGWLFAPPLCACHLANPALIGVLADGSRVVWLEINGPAATPGLLRRLLDSVRGVRNVHSAGSVRPASI